MSVLCEPSLRVYDSLWLGTQKTTKYSMLTILCHMNTASISHLKETRLGQLENRYKVENPWLQMDHIFYIDFECICSLSWDFRDPNNQKQIVLLAKLRNHDWNNGIIWDTAEI